MAVTSSRLHGWIGVFSVLAILLLSSLLIVSPASAGSGSASNVSPAVAHPDTAGIAVAYTATSNCTDAAFTSCHVTLSTSAASVILVFVSERGATTPTVQAHGHTFAEFDSYTVFGLLVYGYWTYGVGSGTAVIYLNNTAGTTLGVLETIDVTGTLDGPGTLNSVAVNGGGPGQYPTIGITTNATSNALFAVYFAGIAYNQYTATFSGNTSQVSLPSRTTSTILNTSGLYDSVNTEHLYAVTADSIGVGAPTASTLKYMTIMANNSHAQYSAVGASLMAGVPKAPTSLVVTGTPEKALVNLSWTNPAGTLTNDLVNLYYDGGNVPPTACTVLIATLSVGVVTTTAVGNLSSGDKYCATVTAVNSTGNGPPSNSVTFTLAASTYAQWLKLPYGGAIPTAQSLSRGQGGTVGVYYDNIYDNLTVRSTGACHLCINVSFPAAKATLTNESSLLTGVTMNVQWGYTGAMLSAGVAVLGIAVLGGVTTTDCQAPNAIYQGNDIYFLYMNSTGDSSPFYVNSTTGHRLIVNDSSSLTNNSWVFYHVPAETQLCVVIESLKTGGGFGTSLPDLLVNFDSRETVSPGWNGACALQGSPKEPWCMAYGLQIQALTTTSATLSWNLAPWLHRQFNNGTATVNYVIYQWSNISSIPLDAFQTSGVLLYKNATPDDNNYIIAAHTLNPVFSSTLSGVYSNTFAVTGLKKNVEYTAAIWLTSSTPRNVIAYPDEASPGFWEYGLTSFGNLNFQTLNTTGAAPAPTSAREVGMNLTAVTFHSFTVKNNASKTQSLSLSLYLLNSADGVYTTPASQAPCSGYGAYYSVGIQTIIGTGNTSIIVGGVSSPVAANANLNGNATYCLSVQAYNSTAPGSFLNMTVYTNATAGNSASLTIFSVTSTSLTFQWYIGPATTNVYLALFSASGGGFTSGAACVTGGGITYTLVSNTSLSSTLSPGSNRFLSPGLTVSTYYCASLGSYAGALLQNVLNVKGYTQTVSGSLVVTSLTISTSNATKIAFSWTNAASATAVTVYLSVWSLNVAYNVCNGATVANSTELAAYTALALGIAITSYSLTISSVQGLYTNGSYCIGIADSNNTLGFGPYSLVLGTFSSGGSGGAIVLTTTELVIAVAVIGVVAVAAIAAYASTRTNKPRGMHRRRRR